MSLEIEQMLQGTRTARRRREQRRERPCQKRRRKQKKGKKEKRLVSKFGDWKGRSEEMERDTSSHPWKKGDLLSFLKTFYSLISDTFEIGHRPFSRFDGVIKIVSSFLANFHFPWRLFFLSLAEVANGPGRKIPGCMQWIQFRHFFPCGFPLVPPALLKKACIYTFFNSSMGEKQIVKENAFKN